MRKLCLIVALVGGVVLAAQASAAPNHKTANAARTAGADWPGASAAEPMPAWFSYHRPAGFAVERKAIQVPMRDGIKLGCTLFAPKGPSSGRYPVIISGFWPYYSPQSFKWEAPLGQFFATHGYADLICAMRGTYTSGGRFPGWWMPLTTGDNYDLVEWAAGQRWSDGRVGEEGVSQAGVNTLKVAAARPPHLVAIAPQFAFKNAYLDYFYPGGIANDPSQSPAQGVTDYRGVSPQEQNAIWAAHPLDDAFWQQASVQSERIDVPTLMIGGWPDYMVTGDIGNYHAVPRNDMWLVMGDWEHGFEPEPLRESMLLAWFDHWLKRSGGALPSARVTSYEMSDRSGNRWAEMPSYPPPHTHTQRLNLTSAGGLDVAAGPSGTSQYAVAAQDGPAAVCFPPGTCDPTHDFADTDSKRLTFTSAPMPKALVVVGRPQVQLRGALSSTDGNLVVKVMDVAPDGQVHQISVGYLKASHRLSQSKAKPVVPSQMTNFVISVWPLDWQLAPGHSLRLSLTSGDSPKIAADAPSGTVTVATGQGGSYIEFLTR
jgi:predicted acyl esterase